MSEIQVTRDIIIRRPVQEVFAYTAAFENLLDWSGPTVCIKRISTETRAVGTRMHIGTEFLGRKVEGDYEIVTWEPPCSVTLKSISGLVCTIYSFWFQRLHEGTQFTLKLTLSAPLRGGSLGCEEAELVHALNLQVENDLQTLRDILEACPRKKG